MNRLTYCHRNNYKKRVPKLWIRQPELFAMPIGSNTTWTQTVLNNKGELIWKILLLILFLWWSYFNQKSWKRFGQYWLGLCWRWLSSFFIVKDGGPVHGFVVFCLSYWLVCLLRLSLSLFSMLYGWFTMVDGEMEMATHKRVLRFIVVAIKMTYFIFNGSNTTWTQTVLNEWPQKSNNTSRLTTRHWKCW